MSDLSILEQNNALIASRSQAAANKALNGTKTDTSAAAARDTLNSDVNFFLTMLTTQLKNQDPTEPMDTTQMTAQIAQYTSVEQQVKTNLNLEKLLSSNKQSELSTAVGYIGKEIETTGASGQVVNGQGAFAYILPQAAQNTQVTIKNSVGNTVFQGEGTSKSGRNLIVWDGKSSTDGRQQPDGTYTISVNAVDGTGKTMIPELRAVGIVSGVENDVAGNITLSIGESKTGFERILAVREPTRAQLSASTVSNNSGT